MESPSQTNTPHQQVYEQVLLAEVRSPPSNLHAKLILPLPQLNKNTSTCLRNYNCKKPESHS